MCIRKKPCQRRTSCADNLASKFSTDPAAAAFLADALYMVEGCGQLYGGLNWGDGFRCNTGGDDASSAAPFFDALLDPAAPKAYRRNVILAPHVPAGSDPIACAPAMSAMYMAQACSVSGSHGVYKAPMVTLPPVLVTQIYPASISMVSSTLGTVLYDALSSSWGTLQTQVRLHPCCSDLSLSAELQTRSQKALLTNRLWQGYCYNGTAACQRFPVIIGEMGSRMVDCRNPCNTRTPNCMDAEMQARS